MSRLLLVIDDEPLIAAAIADALSDLGVRVLAAANGAEGLACLAGERPALVLLDLWMPVMGGQATLDAIRALPGGDALPVVVMSAGAEECVGATELLRKPFAYEELLATVGRYLDVGSSTPHS